MRSLLTALGVVIGVGAVIAMEAIGEGAKARVAQTFESMGTNLLIVLPGSTSAGGLQGGWGTQPTLTWDDLQGIRAELPAVRTAAPVLRAASTVQSDEQNWTISIVGTSPPYLAIRAWSMAAGRAFDQGDVDAEPRW